MSTEENQNDSVQSQEDTGEGDTGSETIAIPKADYEKLNQTLGGLKREIKDLKKSKDETRDTPTKNDNSDNQSNENGLLEKFDRLALKTEGITQEDEVELAKRLKKETGKDMEDLLNSKYFKTELESLRESRANTAAISDVRGGRGKTEAKSTAEYWMAKGTPPSRDDVPDRKARASIARAMMANAKDGKKFYND